MANSHDFMEVKFEELSQNIKDYIQELYNKHDINFTEADPYGQVLSVMSKIHESSMLYLKNVISKFEDHIQEETLANKMIDSVDGAVIDKNIEILGKNIKVTMIEAAE